MRRAATLVASSVLVGLLAAPAQAAGGQAHGTLSYIQASPKTVAQGAVTNPLTGTCYPFPVDAALLVYNDTDRDAETFRSADCSGTAEKLPHGGGGVGSFAAVRFIDS
jgi:hypothetical protein